VRDPTASATFEPPWGAHRSPLEFHLEDQFERCGGWGAAAAHLWAARRPPAVPPAVPASAHACSHGCM